MTRFLSFRARSARALAMAGVVLSTLLGACAADDAAQRLAPTQPSRSSTAGGILEVTPTTYDFGGVLVSQDSRVQEFRITNTGTNIVYLTADFAKTGPDTADFQFVSPSGPSCSYGGDWFLEPGASCYAAMLFRPTATGARTATLDVASTAGTSTVSVSGTGLAPAPIITFDPDTTSFGQQIVGMPAERTVRITNTGTADLVITGFGIGGNDYADFSAIANGSSNPCPLGAPITPQTSCDVLVEFGPTAVGARSARLVVSSPSGDAAATLTGTGIVGGDVAVSMSVAQSARTLTYTIGLTNVGTSFAYRVSLNDILPTGTVFAALSKPSDVNCYGPPVGSTGTLGCTMSGLASGDSRTIQLSVKLDGGVKGKVVNTASVSTMSLDPNKTNDAATATVQIGKR